MKDILDLRFIIGFFFTLVGLFLLVGSFIMHPEANKTETVNFYSGIVYILFGIVMLLLWRFHRPEIKDN
jgi:uncharacterized membrane protein HdeD (DUF308 family)